ncbi:hypothetical protein DL767_010906 [Monosporascus sp. MG133]|nr:hypothetical protein DL767_010906 [Monosporascus sp. MG133]
MAHAPFYNVFLRLPPSAAFLFLASILRTADGHALPRQTKTIEPHELNVVAWPPLPTDAPISPFELRRRQENTICGYIGGNSALPATCAPGSHCVLDTANGVVGCCPNGGICTTGIFTSCVDGNSGPQTEINPYIYTCGGSDVCYNNVYAGGYSQYGCGTASDLGTTVETSVAGLTTSLDLPEVSVYLTQKPSSLSEPTTIGSLTRTSATESSSTDSSTRTSSRGSTSSSFTTSSTSSTTTTTTTSTNSESSPTVLPTEAPSTEDTRDSRTGAIVGGVLGGVAGLIVLAALAFFFWRRRQANGREGPGPAPAAPPRTEYTSPMRSHGAAFAPLPGWQEERQLSPSPYGNPYGNPYGQQHYESESTAYQPEIGVNYNTAPLGPPPRRYDPVHVPGVGTGLAPVEEEASVENPTREIEDFSRAYADAQIGQVPDEDQQPLTIPEERTGSGSGSESEHGRSPVRGGNRPLWQQNRQRSRNMMWM